MMRSKKLASDKNSDVRHKIAIRPNLNESIIEKLAKDESELICYVIAKRQDLSDDMIKILSSLAVKHRPLGR